MTTSAPNTRSPAEDFLLRRGVVVAIASVLLFLECAAWGSWLLPESHLQRCVLSGVVCALAVGLPYLMMRQSPETASFDGSWLGGGLRPWLFIFPFTTLLIATNVIIQQLANIFFGWFFPGARDLPAMFTPADVAIQTSLVLVIIPVAEEVLFRGFTLGLLQKLVSSRIAVLLQAILFAAAHLGPELRPGRVIGSFAMALAFGAWRLRFRGLLPLMVVHGLVNAFAWLPLATIERDAVNRPECRGMEALLDQPASKAVPAILVHVGSEDEFVQAYAINLLVKRYLIDAKPFVRDALESVDPALVDGAMYVCQEAGYTDFIPEIRALASSHALFKLRGLALFRLQAFKDIEGLRTIAASNPDPETSKLASRLLKSLVDRHDTGSAPKNNAVDNDSAGVGHDGTALPVPLSSPFRLGVPVAGRSKV